MHTICPRCSHSVRKGANYCGVCGANLNALIVSEPMAYAATQTKEASVHHTNSKKQGKAKERDKGRTAAKVAIFLLILVIGLAVIMQYWTEILILLGQGITSLFTV